MQHFFEFLNKLIDEDSWKHVGVLIMLLLLCFTALVLYENYTNSFFLGKAEKTVNLIKELASLPEYITEKNKSELSDLSRSITEQIKSATETRPFHLDAPAFVKKILATSAPWFIALLIAFVSEKNDKRSIIGGFSLLCVAGVVIGLTLPWQNVIWANYWLYPITHFILIFGAIVVFATKKMP